MPTIQDFKDLTERKLEEVNILFSSGAYDGAKYLSGYIIECALKARICKVLDIDFPDNGEVGRLYKSHDFAKLITLSGLTKELDIRKSQPGNFAANWSLVTSWNETLRYEINHSNKSEIEEILLAIEDPNDGVLTWIKTLW